MRGVSEAQNWCLYLAKKFGFIPRSVVWDLLAPKGKTARYAYWGEFQKSSLFAPYRIGNSSPEYLILSPKGKELMGDDSVSEVNNIYLEHDEIVMRFCLLLIQKHSVAQSWSEGELKKDRVMAIKNLGDGVVSKLPDLLFDLGKVSSAKRFALEIERTRKSRGRYQTMCRAYGRAIYIDSLLFGVKDDSIEDAIKFEITEGGLEFANKEVGFFCIDDYLENSFQAKVRVGSKEFSLEEYFLKSISNGSENAENRRYAVRGNLKEVSGDSWS